MNASERKAIRELLDQRFSLLHRELQRRMDHLRVEVAKQIRADAADRIAQVNEHLDAVFTKAEELGVAVAYADRYGNSIGDQMKRRYLSADVVGVARKADAAVAAYAEQHAVGQIELDRMAYELFEELTLTALTSEDARSFLDRIPKVDALLPMPADVNVVKQLGV